MLRRSFGMKQIIVKRSGGAAEGVYSIYILCDVWNAGKRWGKFASSYWASPLHSLSWYSF